MNITVYLGARTGGKPCWTEAAKEIGQWIANNGHTLIYGGSRVGLMGILADEAVRGGAPVIGVEPQFFIDEGLLHTGITETIPVATMAERRSVMMEMGDGFIALPGGFGTLDEISEAIIMGALGKHGKPCVFYNKEGYYDKLAAFFDQMVREGFVLPEKRAAVHFTSEIGDLDAIFAGRAGQ